MRFLGLFVLFVSIVLTGCSNQVILDKSTLDQNQTVTVSLRSGNNISGTISKIEDGALIIRDSAGKTWRAKNDAIVGISGPQPVYDNNNQLITENEILLNKNSSNKWIYLASGGVLSMGASFFLSSMISRGFDDDSRDPIIIGGTAAGTVLGAVIFSRIGAKKDRQEAIEMIKIRRGANAEDQIMLEKERKEQIEKEIEELKKKMEK